MNLALTRKQFLDTGIFGELRDEKGGLVAVTLEHSYSCVPKIPPGTFTCKRGMHRLESMNQDFETFEIMDVPGHSNILFHFGNVNGDSAGCVLLGEEVWHEMITKSRITFAAFMALQAGVDSFELLVE